MTTYYSEDHEWITVEGDTATLGITKHAADQLGEVVFIEQQDSGEEFEKGGEIGVIESAKAASEIYAPLAGEITEVNEDLAHNPSALNEDPEGGAWFFKLKPSDLSPMDDYMDEAAYKEMTE